MARGKMSAGNYLWANSAQRSSGGLTVAAWIKPDTHVSNSQIWGVNDYDQTKVWLRLCHIDAGSVNMQWRNGGASVQAASSNQSTYLIDDIWQFVAGTYVPGSFLRVYLGTVEDEVSAGGLAWPANLDRTGVGVRFAGSVADQFLDSHIGCLGVWSAALSSPSLNALAGGMDFRWKSNPSMVAYYEMDGTDNAIDLLGSFDYTEVGTVGEVDGPPVRRRGTRPWEFGYAGVAA